MGRVFARLVIAIVIVSFARVSLAPAATPPFLPGGTPFLETGAAAEIPPGFIGFCVRFADQCQLPANAAATVSLTRDVLRTLNRVNYKINTSIWPEDDSTHFGRAEYWTIPTDGRGNCHAFALAKRKALIDAGLPAPALRIAIAITQSGERHVVLTVATDQGDYVLDNLRDDVVMWNVTGYTWIERQDPKRPLGWVSLQPPIRLAADENRPFGEGLNLPSISDGKIPLMNARKVQLSDVANLFKHLPFDEPIDRVLLADGSTSARFGRDITGSRMSEVFAPDKAETYVATRHAMTLHARLAAAVQQMRSETVRLYGLVPERIKIWAFLGAFLFA